MLLLKRNTISNNALMLFTRQLATLINAAVPLMQSLTILEQQETNVVLKKTIAELIHLIQAGSTLSDALATHPQIFHPLYISMTKAGELGGILGIAFDRLAALQEKRQKVKNKISSILVYPVIVLIMTVLIMTFLLVFIAPRFEAIFADTLQGERLPRMTEWVLQMSRYGRGHFFGIMAVLSILILAFYSLCQTKQGRFFFDRLMLKIPLLGTLLQKTSIARFSNTLGTLMNNGVPTLQALRIAQEVSDNRAIGSAINNVYDSVQAGDSFIHPMRASGLFPPMVMSMIAIGEETAQLPTMLLNVAAIYDDEVDHKISQLIAMIEPLMILFLALLVGSIVIALFLPLISMMSGLQNQ